MKFKKLFFHDLRKMHSAYQMKQRGEKFYFYKHLHSIMHLSRFTRTRLEKI